MVDFGKAIRRVFEPDRPRRRSGQPMHLTVLEIFTGI
jgi:hypothetical protein